MPAKESWRIVCTRCHEEGDAVYREPGSDAVLFTTVVFSFPLLFLPALILLFLRNAAEGHACRICGPRQVVPVGSRRAPAILAGDERG